MDGLTIVELRKLCEEGRIRWTDHVLKRLMQRGIAQADVIHAIMGGEIIEQYPDDYPYPSCLVFGLSIDGEILHAVCGCGDGALWMITAYYPNDIEWEADKKTRRKVQK